MTAERSVGLDCGRTVAVVAVVFVHTQANVPFTTACDVATRFAVPFFFLLAGFFLRVPAGPIAPALRQVALRTLAPFALWLAIYLLWFQPPMSDWRSPIFLVKLLVQGGPAHHLWFLPSLAVSSALLLVLLKRGAAPGTVAAIAAGLYLVGLLFGAYHDAVFGGDFFWNTRNGPFFGFPFMAIGALIARSPVRPTLAASLAILVAGAALHAGEIVTLDRFGVRFEHDQLLGTLPYALGFFLTAMNLPANAATSALARLGPYSLGIYCVHLLAIEGVQAALAPVAPTPPTSPYLVGLLAAVLSIGFCAVLVQVPALAPLVRTGRRTPAYGKATLRPAG